MTSTAQSRARGHDAAALESAQRQRQFAGPGQHGPKVPAPKPQPKPVHEHRWQEYAGIEQCTSCLDVRGHDFGRSEE